MGLFLGASACRPSHNFGVLQPSTSIRQFRFHVGISHKVSGIWLSCLSELLRLGTARPIIRWGAPVLHAPARPVTEFGSDLQDLLADMFATNTAANGAGLAAQQIGVDLAVFIYDCTDEVGAQRTGVVCNPVVDLPEGINRQLVEYGEGCLSLPGAFTDLARPDFSTCRGLDQFGNSIEITAAAPLGDASNTRLTTSTALSSATDFRRANANSSIATTTRYRTNMQPIGQRDRASGGQTRPRIRSIHLNYKRHSRSGLNSPLPEVVFVFRLVRPWVSDLRGCGVGWLQAANLGESAGGRLMG